MATHTRLRMHPDCTAAEVNYSITERETLAVIYCLEHFRDIILRCKIRVWIDHSAVQNLFKHKNLRGRLARWFVTLQNYEISFEYIPGKRNTVVDALSRNTASLEEVNSVVCALQELTTLDRELVYSEHSNNWRHYKQNSLRHDGLGQTTRPLRKAYRRYRPRRKKIYINK